MADLTSAQRLAAYRAELLEAGFDAGQVDDLVQIAAPRIEDVEVQADLDDDGPSIGTVNVRMDPHLDEDELRRIVERVHTATRSAAR